MGLLLLALFHAYIGARLVPALPTEAGLALGVGLVLVYGLLTASLFGRHHPPAALTWAGLMSIGFFSSLLVLTVLRDVLLLGVAGLQLAGVRLAPAGTWASVSAWAVPALALGASALGFANARRHPAVRHVDVPLAGLDPALHGFSIVQITDLHVGPTIRREFVQAVVDTANQLAPDLMVVTGDMVDGRVAALREHTEPLGVLRARHGVFAVTGNHEYYSGVRDWTAEFKRLGMTLLLNEHVLIRHGEAGLLLAGVTDYTAHQFDASHRSDPVRALRAARCAGRRRAARAAGPPAAQRRGGRSRRVRPAVVRPHARRPVPAVEPAGAPAAALHRRAAPPWPHVGVREPRRGLLGPAQAAGRTVRDHAAAAGAAASAASAERLTTLLQAVRCAAMKSRYQSALLLGMRRCVG